MLNTFAGNSPITPNVPSNAKSQLAGIALNALQTLAPKILPKGIDTSFSGVGLGNINLGNYGAGSALPSPLSQSQGLGYRGDEYLGTKPMYQDMYGTQRANRVADYQAQMSAQIPYLQAAMNTASMQQPRIFGASKGNYYDRMGMAAMADAAKWAAQTPRAFGRQGAPNTPNFI
tara:strand:- start:437 stop:958 length:522 start_codon:yes stop_codon:yes gene_type:complete